MIRNALYYQIKPLVPRKLRIRLRGWLAKKKRRRIQEVWPVLPGSERPPQGWPGWPEGKQFAFVLTHDVEGQSGLDKCRQLMELEKKHRFHSSFNFIPEGDYQVSAELRDELQREEFEVGVHDLHHDGKLFRSKWEFNRNAARINHYLEQWGAVGFRAGFMLHNLKWLHELKVAYDASTFDTDPFEPQPDGVHTIFPFWVPRPTPGAERVECVADCAHLALPNLASGSQHVEFAPGYVELPYTLPQDSTLFLLLGERTSDIWLRKLDWVARNGGMVLVNTHPDYMALPGNGESTWHFPVELYEQLLEYVRSRYSGAYWNALPREVAQFVRKSGMVHHPSTQPETITEPVTSIANCHSNTGTPTRSEFGSARGKRAAVIVFGDYLSDARVRRQAEALAQLGMKVEAVSLKENEGDPLRETVNGVNIVRLPFKHWRGNKLGYVFHYGIFTITSLLLLGFRSLARRYCIVHANNMPDFLVFAALVPKAFGAKVILDLHDPMPELMMSIFGLEQESFYVRLLKWLEKISTGFANLVLTPNAAFERLFAGRSCRADKLRVVLNSPDEGIFKYRDLDEQTSVVRDPSGPFVIMYHGSLVERHGLDLAVLALEKARRSIAKAELHIYGFATPFLHQVMELARGRGMDKAVRYLGAKSLEQIVEAIDHCDVGIIPNRRSLFTEINFPTRIFEYLARGKPVIAPLTEGIQDYFSKDDLVVFEMGNADDLARKMELVFSHPRETSVIVKRGQAVYRAHAWGIERSRFWAMICGLLDHSGDRLRTEALANGQAIPAVTASK